MKPAAGSPLWLLRHELRLQWRSASGKANLALMAALGLVFLHLFAFPIAMLVGHLQPPPPSMTYAIVTGGALFLFLMMTSSALVAAVQAIFARGDVDLLLSSPIEPRSMMMVRAGAITLNVCAGWALLTLPFANVLGLMVSPRWFVVYPALAVVALPATTVSLVVALGLFRLMGPRRTRVFGQVLGGLLGVAGFLLLQLPNILNSTDSSATTRGVADWAANIALPGPNSLVWLPARALTGEPLPLAIALVLSGGLFWLTIRGLAGHFIASLTATAEASRAPTTPKASSRRFRSGAVAVMRSKELRLIGRDPWLVTSIMQQVVFLVPLGAMAWKHGIDNIPLTWLVLVLITGNLASAFSWIVVSGEDAPELLAASPLRPLHMLLAKFEAALLATGLAMAVPIAVAAYVHAWLGVTLAVCCTGAAVSCTMLQLFNPNPGKRSEFNKRAKGRWIIGVAEFALAAGWCATAAGMLLATPWALIGPPLLLGLPILQKLGTLEDWLDGDPLAATR